MFGVKSIFVQLRFYTVIYFALNEGEKMFTFNISLCTLPKGLISIKYKFPLIALARPKMAGFMVDPGWCEGRFMTVQ